MRLINSIVCVKIDDGYLLINSLNGLIDFISVNTAQILEDWDKQDIIEAKTKEERLLYARLLERGYLCTSKEEEQETKDKFVKTLGKRWKENKSIETITIVMTYDCNFRCPYCFESKNNELKGRDISKEQIDALLGMVGDSLKHISLFGGEPLLPRNREKIEYLIRKAPDKSYDVITNGYYLDQFVDLFATINISYIMVTLDGKKEVHDKRRFLANGAPSFDRIMQNIDKCLVKRIPVRIRMNVDENTIESAGIMRKTLLNRYKSSSELLSFEISPMMEMGIANRNDMFGILAEKEKDYDLGNGNNVFLSRFSPIVNCIVYGKRLYPTYSYCAEHHNKYIVDPFGYIYPCLISVGKKEYAIGRYYPEVQFFENSVRNRNIETIKRCNNCKYSLLCGGGCPLKLPDNKDIFQPECNSIMNDIYNIIPKLINARKNSRDENDY